MLGADKTISAFLVGSAIVLPTTVTLSAPPKVWYQLKTDKSFRDNCRLAVQDELNQKWLIVCSFDIEDGGDNSPKFFLYSFGYPPVETLKIKRWLNQGNEIEIQIGSHKESNQTLIKKEKIKVPKQSEWDKWSDFEIGGCDFPFNNLKGSKNWTIECEHESQKKLVGQRNVSSKKQQFQLIPLPFK